MKYFSKESLVDIESLISSDFKFYAHKEQNDRWEKELLIEHVNRCNKYFFKIDRSKLVWMIFKRFEELYLYDVCDEAKILYREMVVNTINFHDIGKINPRFQSDKMENKILDEEIFIGLGSKHSIISSVLYIDYYIDKVNSFKKYKDKSFDKLSQILILNAYIISRHHGDLNEFQSFVNSLQNDQEEYGNAVIESLLDDTYKKIYKKEASSNIKTVRKKSSNAIRNLKKISKEESIYVYTYVKLLFSILVACDFYATSEYMENVELEEFGEIDDISIFYDIYKENDIYKKIRDYEKEKYKKEKDLSKEKNINILRTEMFLDAEQELCKNIDNNIFYLEAPTGSGKSNVSLNLSFKLLEKNPTLRKIYYIYPFNTLIEQNINSIEKIFKSEDKNNEDILKKIAVINSITPIKVDEEKAKYEELKEESDYKYYSKALLDRQFLNYPMVLSTHVSLFNTMFGTKKESVFRFHQLANSVIILDEIQSYKNNIWSEIIIFLKGFSRMLNMKVIIMSATLPNLNYLTNSSSDTITLINDREKYFSHPLFKNRVKISYKLIDKQIEEVYNHVKENSYKGKKIIIEFIKKQSAYDFYNKLKEDNEIESRVELITGDDNSIERKRILSIVDKAEDIILVATQVVEAGVDIDMDIGYKDISKLDSEEQFMGRINRSCKKFGQVYFFNLDSVRMIYKDDIRVNKQFTLENDEMEDVLVKKDFKRYYQPVLEVLKENYNNSSWDTNLEDFFSKDVGMLYFKKVEDKMKLIEDDLLSISVYLCTNIEREDGSILNGKEVWDNYIRLLDDKKLKYAEKEVKLSEARSLLNYFIYQVKKTDIPYSDRVGELYFIEDGEKYFKDGKIDKEKLITGIGDFI